MKVVRAKNLINTERDVRCPKGGFNSIRLLLESDGMGYSITRTTIPKCDPQFWHYKNHLESCYCISGHGILEDIETGIKYDIVPDTLYVLDKCDAHKFTALSEQVILICVFNPPLKGKEVHMEDGSYAN
jgi:L-ectoine synthase